jgi:hypothetical protein
LFPIPSSWNCSAKSKYIELVNAKVGMNLSSCSLMGKITAIPENDRELLLSITNFDLVYSLSHSIENENITWNAKFYRMSSKMKL